MRKTLATLYPENGTNLALLILRLGLAILTMHHGYQKLLHFDAMKIGFLNFLGLGSSVSLAIAMIVELFGSILIALGLFTRAAAIPLMIIMSIALFKIKEGDIFGGGESAALYLLGYLCLLVGGPGTLSIDGIFAKESQG
ncbi:MAG: DoxX family protein [Bacteroidetes bacterium]|nr:DoxX family protein [Bacteroidota bacterium]